MSAFYDLASLVVVPSGYKSGKVYAQKPQTTDGQLTFTRASSATRVASNGLIEKVRTNVLLQSVWPNIGTGVAPTSWTVGTGPAINFSAGPLTGQLLCNTSSNRGFIGQSVSLTAGQYALSVFVDSVTTAGALSQMISIFGATDLKYYEDGLEVSSSASIVAGKRYAVVGTVTTGSFGLRVGSGVSGNTTGNFVISRPQLEVSDFGATDYIPTTTAAVSVGPVSGLPRLDYLNSTCPRLILEPSRTNLILRSEALNTTWAPNGTPTITANTTVSPDGTKNADTVAVATAGNGVFQAFAVTISAAHTFSVYLKNISSATNVFIGCDTFPTNATIAFNAVTGAIISTGAGITSSSVTNAGNGWYRVRGTYTSTGVANTFIIYGQGVMSFSAWGAQVEAGAYATSYIPTLGASVTRVAESAVKASVTSLIGQTEGTIFMDAVIDAFPTDNSFFGVQKTASNFVIRFGSGGSSVYAQAYNGTTNLFFEPTSYTLGTRIKLAFGYKAGSYAFYKNGALVATGTNATAMPACDSIMTNSLWGSIGSGKHGISQALLFTTRLTNAQLAELTAL
jgi:hypothetical protein